MVTQIQIPTDWVLRKVGEIAPLQRGFDLPTKQIVKGEYPVVYSNGILNYHNTFQAKAPGVVTGRSGTIGKVTYVEQDYWPHNTSLWVTDFKGNDPKFVYYLYSFLRLERFSTGSGVPTLNRNDVHTFEILIPKYRKEQSVLAKALSDTDALIESLDKLIEKKKNIKQGAMQELLTGKVRISGFHDAWETKEIYRFADVTAGGTPSTFFPAYWNGDIKWMSSGELNLKKVYDVDGRITELGLKNSSTQLLPKKCVLIGLAGQGKTRGTVAMNYIELCTNQSIGAILPNDNFVPEFLYYNLDSRYNELRQLSTGEGGRGGLNLTIIRNILVTLPQTKKEQSAIAKLLEDMDLEIKALEQKRDKYKQLKVGLMQQLLTGRIRLKCKN